MPEKINNKVKHWFALYTKPRHEFKALEQIRALSIEVYLPTIIVKKKWSDRKKKVEEPIFRGYIFIYADGHERLISIQQSSIVRTICFNGKPSIIPEWQIENLRRLLSEKPEVFVTDKIEVGAKVRITDGPFSDVIGIVTEYKKGEKYLAVSIDLLRRSVLVRLPEESIVKIVEN
ncbi:MAG: UpxY family transcription antiterminator [Melioribacteraceae bacterium]|nr:UpxY family transcription antiterminator [Melioribacteraceae bacterium]